MKKSAIPVGGLYIVAFVVLMSLAGMSLYLFLESQSISSDYRIAAASLTQVTESLKNIIDQERLYVVETVLFFIGSQSGIENVADYNRLNSTLAGADNEVRACIEKLNERLGAASEELLSRCGRSNSAVYNNEESIGAWKCDDQMYSYSQCNSITKLGAKLCCEQGATDTYYNMDPNARVTGYVCHQGCITALEGEEANCFGLDNCGALWCKENNLEIPETYTGVPYYQRLIIDSGQAGPGYYCLSSELFTPEQTYNHISITQSLTTQEVINELIELANDYFYLPTPSFKNYLQNEFNTEIDIAFQLEFVGCNEDVCEFTWVPFGNTEQTFIGRGVGGVEMIEFSAEFLSQLTVQIPIEDMIDSSTELINSGEIKNYFANSLRDLTLNRGFSNSKNMPALSDWNTIYGESLGVDCNGPDGKSGEQALIDSEYDGWFYDDSGCGQYPWNNSCSYNCLMQWVNTEIYNTINEPMTFDRESGYDYSLRPVMRFVENSMGTSITPSETSFTVLAGDYHVFVRGTGNVDTTITIDGQDIDFSHSGTGDFYETATGIWEGTCAKRINIDSASDLDEFEIGCCDNIDNDNVCIGNFYSNIYCSDSFGYGFNSIGKACNMNNGNVDYNREMIILTEGTHNITITNSANIETIDILRIRYDNSFETITDETGTIRGGSMEYYTDTEDCESPQGDNFVEYNELSDEELWYSMLCLRGQQVSWEDIILDFTGLYNEFFDSFSENDAIDIDDFINTYGVYVAEPDENSNVSLLIFNEESYALEGLNEINEELVYNESEVELEFLSSVEEQLYEIGLNSSYLSLPMKWVFAYNDQFMFDQTMVNSPEDEGCNLQYADVGGESFPDCGCQTCEASAVCDFDFSNIPTSSLQNELYDFIEIFVTNYGDYGTEGVTEVRDI